jgi:predicted RNA-binding protein associated with RNAse of E/G family
LLIDVLIYPDGRVEVVDMDEFADMIEQEVLSRQASIDALRYTNHLLELIYSGHFSQLTHYVEDAEKAAACS